MLKAHGLTPINKDWPWITTAAISVEFFFVVMGWFLIKGVNRHQEKYGNLGLWRSWWIFFKKKILSYFVPCIIPGIVTNILTLFYDGGIPNGLLWMYWFIHDALVVMFIYYIIFYKIKNNNKRIITISLIFIVSYVVKFVLTYYFAGIVIIFDFPRALSCVSFGILCSLIPSLKKNNNLNKIVAWVFFIIVFCLEISLVVLPSKLIFGINNDFYKDIINILLFPCLIYSCLWIGLSLRPLNYIGKWSKGLYMWQMVPYSIMVICKFYGLNVSSIGFGWLFLCMTLLLTILEDPVRWIIKKTKARNATKNPEYLVAKNVKKEKFNKIYWRKSTHIILSIIAASCLIACATMGMYGLVDGLIHNNHFNLFVDPLTNRNTFYCDGMILLMASTLIIGIFPFNYFLTNKIEKKKNK